MAQPQTQQETKTRKDPIARPNDGGLGAIELVQKRPDRVYCWVSLESGAVFQYEYAGYSKVKYATGGVRPKYGNLTEGQDIISPYGVLMEIPADQKKSQDEQGWAETQRFEERMVDRRKVVADTMRGLHARPHHVSLESEIGGLEPTR